MEKLIERLDSLVNWEAVGGRSEGRPEKIIERFLSDSKKHDVGTFEKWLRRETSLLPRKAREEKRVTQMELILRNNRKS